MLKSINIQTTCNMYIGCFWLYWWHQWSYLILEAQSRWQVLQFQPKYPLPLRFSVSWCMASQTLHCPLFAVCCSSDHYVRMNGNNRYHTRYRPNESCRWRNDMVQFRPCNWELPWFSKWVSLVDIIWTWLSLNGKVYGSSTITSWMLFKSVIVCCWWSAFTLDSRATSNTQYVLGPSPIHSLRINNVKWFVSRVVLSQLLAQIVFKDMWFVVRMVFLRLLFGGRIWTSFWSGTFRIQFVKRTNDTRHIITRFCRENNGANQQRARSAILCRINSNRILRHVSEWKHSQ